MIPELEDIEFNGDPQSGPELVPSPYLDTRTAAFKGRVQVHALLHEVEGHLAFGEGFLKPL